jgi:acyl carrier protein
MADSFLTHDVIEKFVIETLVELGADREKITVDSSFDDIGLDSLHVTYMGQLVKREFGIDLSPTDLYEILVLREALAVICAKAAL